MSTFAGLNQFWIMSKGFGLNLILKLDLGLILLLEWFVNIPKFTTMQKIQVKSSFWRRKPSSKTGPETAGLAPNRLFCLSGWFCLIWWVFFAPTWPLASLEAGKASGVVQSSLVHKEVTKIRRKAKKRSGSDWPAKKQTCSLPFLSPTCASGWSLMLITCFRFKLT